MTSARPADTTDDQLHALREIICRLLCANYPDAIAYGAGWTDPARQQPVGDTGRHEPRHVDAIVAAELERALGDPDPLRGVAQLVAPWGAAFVLDPDGVTRTKALERYAAARRRWGSTARSGGLDGAWRRTRSCATATSTGRPARRSRDRCRAGPRQASRRGRGCSASPTTPAGGRPPTTPASPASARDGTPLPRVARALVRSPEAVRRRRRHLDLEPPPTAEAPRSGRPWTPSADAVLRLHRGLNTATLAEWLGRSDHAIGARLHALGLRRERRRSPHHPTARGGGLTPAQRAVIRRAPDPLKPATVVTLARRLDLPAETVREVARRAAG